jgi:hypothetical protein
MWFILIGILMTVSVAEKMTVIIVFSIVLLLAVMIINFVWPQLGVDWEEDFDAMGFVLSVALGLGLVLGLTAVLTAAVTQPVSGRLLGIWWVPLGLAAPELAATFGLTTALVFDLCMNAFVVAPAEELMKVAGFGVLNEVWGEPVGVPVVVGMWAIAHGIVSYPSLWLAIPTFAAGLFMYYWMKRSGEVYTAVLIHALYNDVIVLGAGASVLGFTLSPSQAAWLALMPLFGITLVKTRVGLNMENRSSTNGGR